MSSDMEQPLVSPSRCCPAPRTASETACCAPSDNSPLAGATLDCCQFYAQDWVRELLGGSFHPGGLELSRRTLDAIGLAAGARVADLGCGSGRTSLLLADEYRAEVHGIDLNHDNLQHAVAGFTSAGLLAQLLNPAFTEVLATDRVPEPGKGFFYPSDTACLPFADASLDAVLCECTLSLFPQAARVLGEIRRCLVPHGQLALTDMALEAPLAEDLQAVLGPWACLNGARSEQAYRDLFSQNGFALNQCVDESETLKELIARLKRQFLVLAASQNLGLITDTAIPRLDLPQIKHYLQRAQDEVATGKIRYLRFHLQALSG